MVGPRKSPCPCGSGKKFKHCCGRIPALPAAPLTVAKAATAKRTGPPASVIAKAIAFFREREQKERDFIERYGHARPAMFVRMGDKVIVAIGSALYKQEREGPYTLFHAMHDHALSFFGVPFLMQEEAKSFDQRHPAIQWMHTYTAHTQRYEQMDDSDPKALQIGAGAAWMRFAYDLFTVADTAKLEARLKTRLLEPKSFQGARHELRVAAWCITAGFDLQFEDESDNSRGHFEFVACDRFSDIRIAVEAKSRQRNGVNGFEGGHVGDPGAVVNVRGVVVDAFTKKTDIPFYVFVDANLPPVGDPQTWDRWMNEINQTMNDLIAEGYGDHCPANTVFISNDPSHYILEQEIGNKSDSLWIMPFEADVPKFPHPQVTMTERLMKAHRQRLAPPADFPDFK